MLDPTIYKDWQIAEEAEKTYASRESGSVKLHIIEKGKHAFSKKHDVIAIDHIRGFIN